MSLTVVNKSNKERIVRVPKGLFMGNPEPHKQPLIASQDTEIRLARGQKKQIDLAAFCGVGCYGVPRESKGKGNRCLRPTRRPPLAAQAAAARHPLPPPPQSTPPQSPPAFTPGAMELTPYVLANPLALKSQGFIWYFLDPFSPSGERFLGPPPPQSPPPQSPPASTSSARS